MVNQSLTTLEPFTKSKHICASKFLIGREQLVPSLWIRSLLLLIKKQKTNTEEHHPFQEVRGPEHLHQHSKSDQAKYPAYRVGAEFGLVTDVRFGLETILSVFPVSHA